MELTGSRSRPSSSPHSKAAAAAALLLAIACACPLAAQETPAPPAGAGVHEIVIGGSRQRFALPECTPRRPDDATRAACRTLTDVLRKDLQFEGIFQFVPDALLKAVPSLNPDAPRMDDWKGIDAQFLVTLTADVSGGNLTVGLRLFFVESGQSMLAKQYSGKVENPRVFAHQAADDIVAQVQYRGVARTKIIFTSDRDATKGKATKELYLVDYDGYNPRRLTVNRSLNILPAWAPDGRSIGYVSYRSGIPELFLAWIFEGRSQNISGGPEKGGQAFAPSFSPDGKRVAYGSSRSGNMEIWVANADGSGARRLTSSPAVDTAPCWSPTGQEIAFTSDRGGTPQIWVMDSEGLNLRRLTNVGNYNDGATWSSSKEHPEIAYTSRIEGRFQVAVVDLASRQVRQVTEASGSCESPSWAPSGRHLVFSCVRGGKWQITVSDREGRRAQTLDTGPGNNTQPDWGPWPTP
jgi:TolB protein